MDGHRVFLTQDGSRSLFSERFGVSYHSKYGAWQETQHVFIDAGLRYAAVDREALRVLDVGYGTGLNAIAALAFAKTRGLTVDYVGVDAYPVPAQTLADLAYPRDLAWDADTRALYDALQGLPWDGKAYVLAEGLHVTKRQERFEALAERDRYDLVFYDAFAPEAQPELWTREQFARVREAMRDGGVLVTYCAKGQVKRDLRAVDFEVEALQGPPGKREMTRATKRSPGGSPAVVP